MSGPRRPPKPSSHAARKGKPASTPAAPDKKSAEKKAAAPAAPAPVAAPPAEGDGDREHPLVHVPSGPPGSAPAGRVVALTGAAGFIGARLVRRLEADPGVAEILAIDVRLPATAGPKTRFVYVDLTQPAAPTRIAEALSHRRADMLVHLAFLANPSHTRSWAHELEAIGTEHVLSACARAGTPKLILWSQTAVYGADPKNPNFLTEDHPLRGNPASRYVTDKVEAEAAFERHAAEHPQTVVTRLRTCTILGPHVKNFVTNFLERPVLPVIMGCDPLLQLVHEDDVITAFELAMAGEFRGAFNIVGEGVLPLSTILGILGKVSVPVPHFLAVPLARALWAAQVVELPPAFLDYLRYLWVADGTRAQRVMGFRPRYTSVECVLDFAGALRPRGEPPVAERAQV
jgi:UDP-glucose 4-epimerase